MPEDLCRLCLFLSSLVAFSVPGTFNTSCMLNTGAMVSSTTSFCLISSNTCKKKCLSHEIYQRPIAETHDKNLMDFLKFKINISLGIETVSTEIDIKILKVMASSETNI